MTLKFLIRLSVIFLLLFLLEKPRLIAQNKMELIAGLNQNQFFDVNRDDGHSYSSYQSALGYSLRIGVENVKMDWMKLRFTVGFDQYGGKIEVTDGGLGGSYTTTAEVNKSVLSLGLFPLNLQVWKRIDFNLGLEFSALIDENYRGIRSGWSLGRPYWREKLEDSYSSYSEKAYWGIRGRLAYDILLMDHVFISPQYSYFLGISNEFKEFQKATRSMRHYFSLGIQWEI